MTNWSKAEERARKLIDAEMRGFPLSAMDGLLMARDFLALRSRVQEFEDAQGLGHPDPCTFGPLCPYCEIERLEQERDRLKAAVFNHLAEVARRGDRIKALEACLREAVEALAYTLEVREIECLHEPYEGAEESCAKCKADAVLAKACELTRDRIDFIDTNGPRGLRLAGTIENPEVPKEEDPLERLEAEAKTHAILTNIKDPEVMP